jgi:hypothetical protein
VQIGIVEVVPKKIILFVVSYQNAQKGGTVSDLSASHTCSKMRTPQLKFEMSVIFIFIPSL